MAEDSDTQECCDSWEELADSRILDKKLEKLHAKSSSLEETGSGKTTVSHVTVIPEDARLRYAFSEPTVRILKRPSKSAGDGEGLVNGDTNKRVVKTLQQREQEYAEARLRILGEAKSPNEDDSVFEEDTSVHQISQKLELLTRPSSFEQLDPLPVAILRPPRGPDGSSGFNQTR
uniref:SUZ RNA-binding domain-containing n=1 Tax=Cacopsylla melanoneura TaxID=428564 RepID=A0A8D9EHD5_9HEMI